LRNEFSDLEDRVSPSTSTFEIWLKMALHVALTVGNLAVLTKVVTHPAFTTILVTNIFEAKLFSLCKAVSSLSSVKSAFVELWKISLTSILEAANIFSGIS